LMLAIMKLLAKPLPAMKTLCSWSDDALQAQQAEAVCLQSIAQVEGCRLFASPPITSTHQSIKARTAGDR
jgi:hypothetical protein